MCLKKNKKLILLLVFVFVIIYLLTKHNENFDRTQMTHDKTKVFSKTPSSVPKSHLLNGGKIQNGSVTNSNIDISFMKNSVINNTIVNNSEINLSDINRSNINDPTINNANINNLSTTGTMRFRSEKKDGNNTIGKDIFTILSNSDLNTPDQLFINVDGRSAIDFTNNDSHIRIGNQLLNRDKLAFLNELYNNSLQAQQQQVKQAQLDQMNNNINTGVTETGDIQIL